MKKFLQLFVLPIRLILTAYGFLQFAIQVLWLSKWLMPRIIGSQENSSAQRKKALFAAHRHVVFYLNTLSFLHLIEFNTVGKPVTTPAIIVANHPCLLDFIVFLRDCPYAVCMYKPESLDNPVLSSFVQVAGYIKGMRGETGETKRIINDCGARLKQGHQIVMFPEGSRSHGAKSFHKFRTTAFHAAIKHRVPIQPVVIYCQPLFLGKGQSWIEFSKTTNKFTLLYLEPVHFDQLAENEQSATGFAKHIEQLIKHTLDNL